jgi:hypothetical protein
LTPSPAITAYAAGQQFRFIAGSSNTGAVTVNVSGLGAKSITKNGTAALTVGDIIAGMIVTVTYDGTRFVMLRNRIQALGSQSASGTSIDLTFPSGIRRITVFFFNISTNGTSPLLVQIGDSGGIETSSYASASTLTVSGGATAGQNSTAGYILASVLAANVLQGKVILDNADNDLSGQTWMASGILMRLAGNSEVMTMAGIKVLSAELTTVRITTVNGTDTFDGGIFLATYEY